MHSGKNITRITNLNNLLEGLAEAGIEFILVGGLATVIQGVPVSTMDIDIVHRQTEENIRKLMKFLQSVSAYYRRPDDKIIEPDERDLSAKGHALFSTDRGPLDILGIIEEGRGYKELLSDTVEIEFRGYSIRVLSLKTIIELKRSSKDTKDIYRLPILEETLQQICDKKS